MPVVALPPSTGPPGTTSRTSSTGRRAQRDLGVDADGLNVRGGNGGPTNWEPLHYDVVGVDGYNRHPDKHVDFKRFQEIFSSAHDFAVRRGKPLGVCEYGCVEQRLTDPMTKAGWFADAGQTMKSWPDLKFACYSHVTTVEGYDYWVDSSASSLHEFRALGADAYFA